LIKGDHRGTYCRQTGLSESYSASLKPIGGYAVTRQLRAALAWNRQTQDQRILFCVLLSEPERPTSISELADRTILLQKESKVVILPPL